MCDKEQKGLDLCLSWFIDCLQASIFYTKVKTDKKVFKLSFACVVPCQRVKWRQVAQLY